jgi:hypothetical protein
MTVTKTKKPPGRPRSKALDLLEKELSVTRRRAKEILKEDGDPGTGLQPVAQARLKKLQLESQRLEVLIRQARIESSLMEKKLLTVDDCIRIFSPPAEIGRQLLETMPKFLAPRLYGQPQKVIEETLLDFVTSTLAAQLSSHNRNMAELGDGQNIDEVL